VKALGTMPRRGNQEGGGAVDVAVTFGGVTFVPGRYVLADEDGVIVLPEGMTPGDLDRADNIGTA
jgi:regulator of ribonuclease activity A